MKKQIVMTKQKGERKMKKEDLDPYKDFGSDQ